MTKYLPVCRWCGYLTEPTTLEHAAMEAANHHAAWPTHPTHYMPASCEIKVKGTPHDCE